VGRTVFDAGQESPEPGSYSQLSKATICLHSQCNESFQSSLPCLQRQHTASPLHLFKCAYITTLKLHPVVVFTCARAHMKMHPCLEMNGGSLSTSRVMHGVKAEPPFGGLPCEFRALTVTCCSPEHRYAYARLGRNALKLAIQLLGSGVGSRLLLC
jgi:hypothetical protein